MAGAELAPGVRDRLLDELIDELAQSVADGWREHDTDLARLRLERDDVDRALYRQSLRLEEHDDPHHPVVTLATKRIEELSARRTTIDETIRTPDARRPDGTRPDEVEAALDAIPDLRPDPPRRDPGHAPISSTPST